MREDMREKLNTEITRKQFLQFLTGAILMVLGLNNLISLLTGGFKTAEHNVYLPTSVSNPDGFGSRKFGT